jgi:D-lactate dehydrogenase
MKIAVFSAKPYDRRYLDAANHAAHTLAFFEARLTAQTAPLAAGHLAVCAFVNDQLDAEVLTLLAHGGTRIVTLRCAGYNHVDLACATALGLTVTHAPAYSPHAIAEHTVALLLSLVRRIPQANARVRAGNFALDGLLGFDLHGKTLGLIGTGRIGVLTGKIMAGFGCTVLAYDPLPSADARVAGFTFCPLDALLARADIVSLHCPLMAATHHLINAATLTQMKPGAVLLNTSRGGLIDTPAALDALDSGQLGLLGIDVYEGEAAYFYEDHSGQPLADPGLARLLAHPNALVTGHQAFFTHEALTAIATTTLDAIDAFDAQLPCAHALTPAPSRLA